MIKILDIKPIENINKYDWNALSCLDRALAIISENVRENSYLYYLLFKPMFKDYLNRDMNLSIGDDKYYEIIQKKSNVFFKHIVKVQNNNNLINTLIKEINDNNALVLVTNNKYRKGSMSFNKKNHPHFIVIKGYNKVKQVFYAIDEDMGVDYSKTENFKNGINYIEQEFDFDYIKNLMSDINCFTKFKEYQDKVFSYYAFKVEKQNMCNENEILNLLNEQCLKLKEENELAIIKKAIEEHSLTLDKNKKLTIEDIAYLKNWIVYPGVLVKLGIHHIQIKILNKFLEIHKYKIYNKLRSEITNLLEKYENIRLLVAKMVIFQDNTIAPIIYNKFENIYETEQLFYKFISNKLI